MTIGTSLFIIAVGAILRYAVTEDTVAGIQIHTAGLILMLVGAAGFVLGLFLMVHTGPRPPDAPGRA
jgi:hypothetical protein